VKIAFGGPADARGSLIGIGMEMGTAHQLVRMDAGALNPNHGNGGVKGNELSVWSDKNFHYHVLKW
jgi:hypothetical protein